MATWRPVADGDVTITGWTRESDGGTPVFGEVDEGIAAADSTGVTRTSEGQIRLTLSAPPGDLGDGSVTAVTLNLRHRQSGRIDDTMTWPFSIVDSAGVALAASGSFGATQNMATVDPYRTTYGNNGAVSFAYVNTGATAAQWADARVLGIPNRSSTKGADIIVWYVDAFDITITYTPTAAPTLHVNPMFHFSPTGRPDWALPSRSLGRIAI